MKKIFFIAQREFGAMVVTKAFLLTLVLFPVLMLGGLFLIPALKKVGGLKERRIVVADATESEKYARLLIEAAQGHNEAIESALRTTDEDDEDNPFKQAELYQIEVAASGELSDEERLSLSDQIRSGELYALVEIPAGFGRLRPQAIPTRLDNANNPSADNPNEVEDEQDESIGDQTAEPVVAGSPNQVIFSSEDAALSDARRWMQQILANQVRTQRLQEMGIDAAAVALADAPIEVSATAPYKMLDDGEIQSASGQSTMISLFLPMGVMMLMFLVIFMAAQPMLESGMEEKQYRIAELLLGNVSARELMTGKLLGNVAGSFVIFSFYAVGALFVIRYNNWSVDLDTAVLPWLLVFQVLGVLFFSSIFLAIGASVSELKEAQSLLLPVWLVLLAPMMVWLEVARDPNDTVALLLSFFPPSAPLTMSMRLAGSQTIPWWNAPLAASLLLLGTLAVVMMAAKIYRTSLLRTDSLGSFKKLFAQLTVASD